MTIFNILFLLFVLGIVNIAYKGKVIDKTNWNRVVILSGLFIVSSFVLLGANFQKLFIALNLPALGIFTITTLIWFLFPKIIRHYGKYPNSYLKDKKGNIRFMVRFEYPTMTIKYFEVLFQQVTFLFIIFVALSGLPTATLISLFTMIVVIIHLGNLLFMDYKWALLYTFLSIPMALLFGFLINQGLVLVTAGIHLAFYLVFNAKYWFNPKYQ